jgi:integrase
VFQKGDRWYGQWYVRGRLVKRSLGPVRAAGSREGLTRTQAEARARELMEETNSAPAPVAERLTVSQVGTRLIKQLTLRGRKTSTTNNYESYLRVHFEPHFGETPIAQITGDDVEDFLEGCLERGASVKTARNYLAFLHAIFDFAIRKRWAYRNPCDEVERPDRAVQDQEIHFLDQTELDALLRAVTVVRSPHKPATIERAASARQLRDVDGLQWKEIAARLGCAESTAVYLYRCDPQLRLEDDLARVERVLYLAAAMTGLRQGELLALRWMDIDWMAQRIRVRRNFVRGEFGTPKSKRSSRSVPLADVVGAELEALSKATAYRSDDELVFGHPHTGKPLDRSLLLKRFKRALKRAGVRQVRFHDLRHTFGTRMASAGVPMRTLQEWMGHRDYKTTLIYADYAPGRQRGRARQRGFRTRGHRRGHQTEQNCTAQGTRRPPWNKGLTAPPTRVIRLWSRRSRVRISSLTLHEKCRFAVLFLFYSSDRRVGSGAVVPLRCTTLSPSNAPLVADRRGERPAEPPDASARRLRFARWQAPGRSHPRDRSRPGPPAPTIAFAGRPVPADPLLATRRARPVR